MFLFVGRRLAVAVIQLFVTSLVIFGVLYNAPGSPIDLLSGGNRLSVEAKEALRQRFHLDEPFLQQYGRWLSGTIRGDFGQSIAANDSVTAVVGPRIPPTLQLAAYAFLLVAIVGVTAGILAAVHRGRIADTMVSAAVLVGSAMSPYVSGTLLLATLSVGMGWFPLFGSGVAGLDRIHHLTLPAVALSIPLIALIARTCRASLSEVLNREFIEVLRSRGFTERRIVGVHALKGALVPVLTVSGLAFGFLISGTVFAENVFGVGGLGSLLIQSVQSKDYAVVQAIVLILVAAFIVLNLAVDVLCVAVDPRLRSAPKP